jgi:hypothetical protein
MSPQGGKYLDGIKFEDFPPKCTVHTQDVCSSSMADSCQNHWTSPKTEEYQCRFSACNNLQVGMCSLLAGKTTMKQPEGTTYPYWRREWPRPCNLVEIDVQPILQDVETEQHNWKDFAYNSPLYSS